MNPADRDALLATVIARPDDDLPRLVFADWLEESGDAAAGARARFIRLQVEEARGADAPTQRLTLKAAAAKVRKQFRDEVDELLIRATYGVTATRRRGFVEEVRGPWGLVLPRLAALMAAAPVTALDLVGQTPARFFAHVGPLARVKTLRFSGEFPHGGQPVVGGTVFDWSAPGNLLTSPTLMGVERLAISGFHLGDAWLVEFLARLLHASLAASLTEFELTGADLTDAGGSVLASAEALNRLSKVVLRSAFGSPFSPEVQAQLRRRFGARLTL